MAAGDRNLEELKSLVVHTLETNGVLGQIRAQLRANVYKAIDRDDERASSPSGPAKILKSPEGRLMAEIVAEFFEFYEFRHSLSVFVPECNLGRERRSRTEVGLDAGLVRVRSDVSILEQLIGLATGSDLRKGGDGWHSSASSTTASSPPPQPTSAASTRPATSEHSLRQSELLAPSASADHGLASGELGRSTAADQVPRSGADSISQGEDLLAEEVAVERRKLLGRLPSLANANNKASSVVEEVSLGEPLEAVRRSSLDEETMPLGRLDRDLGRSGGSPPLVDETPVSSSPQATAAEVPRSAPGSASGSLSEQHHQLQRTASRSPATSAAGSPNGSPIPSAGSSPANSNRGMLAASAAGSSASAGARSDIPEAVGSGIHSEPNSPSSGFVMLSAAGGVEAPEESISMDDSLGSDLGLGGGGNRLLRAPAALDSPGPLGGAQEVDDEDIEEDDGYDDSSHSISGHQESEANQSSADKF